MSFVREYELSLQKINQNLFSRYVLL